MVFKLWIKTMLDMGIDNPTPDTVELDLWISELPFAEYLYLIDLLIDY